jgi:hypothetical protein
MNKIKIAVIKRSTYLLFLATINLFLIAASCEKHDPLETDPSKIILGKWETIEMGNYPNMWTVENSSGYAEYLSDSGLREYSYETGEYFYKKYWIDSAILVQAVYLPDGSVMPFSHYTFKFIDKNNTLELTTYQMAAIFNSSVHKRIK